jgi:hypothetical protein
MPWRHIRVGHVFRFVQSLLTAALLLKCSSFSRLVARMRARRASTGAEPDVAVVRELLSAFYHIRTVFYRPKARCLLDSLVLLEFMAHYGQTPLWVVGVQITPFASHSWLQHGRTVLNGTPAYVRAYTPILVV